MEVSLYLPNRQEVPLGLKFLDVSIITFSGVNPKSGAKIGRYDAG